MKKIKTIEISVIKLAGIILIVIGLLLGVIFYYSYQTSECLSNPVNFANNYSENYWWDSVTAINYDRYDLE